MEQQTNQMVLKAKLKQVITAIKQRIHKKHQLLLIQIRNDLVKAKANRNAKVASKALRKVNTRTPSFLKLYPLQRIIRNARLTFEHQIEEIYVTNSSGVLHIYDVIESNGRKCLLEVKTGTSSVYQVSSILFAKFAERIHLGKTVLFCLE